MSFHERGSFKEFSLEWVTNTETKNFKIHTEGLRQPFTICYELPEVGHLAQAGEPFREIYFKLIVLFAGFYIDMFCFVLNVFWDCSLFIYY